MNKEKKVSLKKSMRLLLSLVIYFLVYRTYQNISYDKNMYQVKKIMEKIYEYVSNLNHYSQSITMQNIDKCLDKDYYFINHPDTIMEDKRIYREHQDILMDAIKANSFDLCNPINETINCTQFSSRIYAIEQHQQNPLKSYLPKTPQHACITNRLISFFITGYPKLYMAQQQAIQLKMLKDNYASPECLKQARFQQDNYRLFNKTECQEVFSYLNKNQNDSKIEFILKSNAHRSAGVELFTLKTKQNYFTKYANGEHCGQINDQVMLQEYTWNPMLHDVFYFGYRLQNRKIELRFFVMFVQANPYIAYVHNLPLGFRCIAPYSPDSEYKEAHICNPFVADDYWKQKEYVVPDAYPLEKAYVLKTMEEWEEYLLSIGHILPKNWAKDHFIPMLVQKTAYMLKTSIRFLSGDLRIGTISAFDSIMDSETFDLRIIDFNAYASITTKNEIQTQYHLQIQKDMMETLMQYTRRRYKNIRQLINDKLYKGETQISDEDYKNYLADTPIQQDQINNMSLINWDTAFKECKPYF